ncbi:MAG: hypothetical protein KA436_08935 [Oligoflexales bacterium]|nr:hypothetical protein [Oligoflexales bacterium]
MSEWEDILKEAKSCHTKHAWESFFSKYGSLISTTNSSRPIAEIFKLLEDDPQSLKYDPNIFGDLIKGCLSAWDLDLGRLICEFGKNITAPSFSIPNVQLSLERGQPNLARSVAYRALRLSRLENRDFHQLQILICSSFAEEGKHGKATKMVQKISSEIGHASLYPKDRADIQVQIARIEFLLGRYAQAGPLFREAASTYLSLQEWESAAKSLFNTAACAQNASKDPIEDAFALIEESRQISEKYKLKGTLSHCEAFHGLTAYQHGNFVKAKEHFRKGLRCLPVTDKSYRRLHILSMLTLTYLKSGEYFLAKKVGRQTLELVALDHSKRYRSRYISLEAELKWEDGQFLESQNLLEIFVADLEVKGIHTLEELSSYSRYLIQSAFLSAPLKNPSKNIKICPSLKKQKFTFFDYQYAQGQVQLSESVYEAHKNFLKIAQETPKYEDRYHYALSLHGLIQTRIIEKKMDKETDQLVHDFEIAVHQISETPLLTQLSIILASTAYHRGDFKECERQLKSCLRNSRKNSNDHLAVACWVATLEGRSFRLTQTWQEQLIARQTKVYFSPSIQVLDQSNFLISDHYHVNLEKYPAISELLIFLLKQPYFNATTSEIQARVWKESLQAKGWEQKIRNTIMRMRDFFPYTLAPLILHNEQIKIFSEAIRIELPKSQGIDRKKEIHRLLKAQPMSSTQLSQRLGLSPATMKREIKILLDGQKIEGIKEGRNILYKPVVSGITPREEPRTHHPAAAKT